MKVELAKSHTHAGTGYAAGDTIDVSASDAAWLAAHDITRAQTKKTRSSSAATDPSPDEESAS